jgi:hypothetical protein
MDELIALYERYLQSQGLPKMSADELLMEDITPSQSEWLTAFITLWELQNAND